MIQGHAGGFPLIDRRHEQTASTIVEIGGGHIVADNTLLYTARLRCTSEDAAAFAGSRIVRRNAAVLYFQNRQGVLYFLARIKFGAVPFRGHCVRGAQGEDAAATVGSEVAGDLTSVDNRVAQREYAATATAVVFQKSDSSGTPVLRSF